MALSGRCVRYGCRMLQRMALPALVSEDISAKPCYAKSVIFAGGLQLQIRYQSKRTGSVLGYKSQDESESDNDFEKRPRAESEFWRRKMRTFHSIVDVNKDGVISFDDFRLLTDRFVQLGHLSETHRHEFQECVKNLWEQLWGEINPYNLVTIEQYLEDMHHVLNDKQLKKKVHKFLPYLFKAIDKDKSGEISVQEFRLFFECLGVDEQHALESFRSIDRDNDGKLCIKEFVKQGKEFFLSEDESHGSKYFWGPLIEH